MSVRSVFVVMLALVCGVSAAFGIKQMKSDTGQPAEVATVPVVVAAVDVPRGRLITKEMVYVKPWPKEQIPQGVVTEADAIVGKTAKFMIVADDAITDKKVGEGLGIEPLLKPGMQAFTIPTPSVAKFLLPGNRVDVYWTVNASEKDEVEQAGRAATGRILSGIEIIAVGNQTEAPADSKSTERLDSVTLAVTRKQVSKLSLAQKMGTLTVALRKRPKDGSAESDDGEDTNQTMKELMDQILNRRIDAAPPKKIVAAPQKAPRPKRAVPKPPTPTTTIVETNIRILHGTSQGNVTLYSYPGVIEHRIPRPPAGN